MSKNSARIGFIGISGRGSGMLDLLLQVEGVTVPAVCDLIPERAEHGIEIVEKRTEKAVFLVLDPKKRKFRFSKRFRRNFPKRTEWAVQKTGVFPIAGLPYAKKRLFLAG